MSGPMYSFRVTSPLVRALLNKLPHRSRFSRMSHLDTLKNPFLIAATCSLGWRGHDGRIHDLLAHGEVSGVLQMRFEPRKKLIDRPDLD